MAEQEIKRLSTSTNATVVQLPERKHPGVVVQGDSLRNLLSLLQEAHSQLAAGELEAATATVEELRDIVQGYKQSLDRATSF